MPSPRSNVIIASIGVFLYFIVPRLILIISLEQNAPSRLHRRSSINEQTRFANIVRNCEDALITAGSRSGYAILSCDVGRDKWNTVMGVFHDKDVPQGKLYIYDYRKVDNKPMPIDLLNFPQSETDFHPLGIEYHQPSDTLYVINHARSGSRIELFKLHLPTSGDGATPNRTQTATHIGTLEHPLLHTPNSIIAQDGTNLYITNDHYFRMRYHTYLAHLETYLAVPGGSIVHFDLTTNTATTVAHIPFANGIAVLNASTIAVASTTTAKIHLYAIDDASHKVTHSKTFSVPFLPDNLSVDDDGVLLIAGHAHMGSITALPHRAARCNSPDPSVDEKGCEGTSPSYIAQWSEGGGLQDLYVGDGYSSATTAVRDVKRGVGLAVGLYERGVLVWGQKE